MRGDLGRLDEIVDMLGQGGGDGFWSGTARSG